MCKGGFDNFGVNGHVEGVGGEIVYRMHWDVHVKAEVREQSVSQFMRRLTG